MSNEAFEKWLKENYLVDMSKFIVDEQERAYIKENNLLRKAWQAAKADSEREIAKLKDKINDLEKEESLLNKWLDNNKLWFDESEKEKAQLKANINDLRETLKQISFYSEIDWIQDNIEQILEKTPAQSLQEHNNEVIEKCARVCDAWSLIGKSIAHDVRTLKGK